MEAVALPLAQLGLPWDPPCLARLPFVSGVPLALQNTRGLSGIWVRLSSAVTHPQVPPHTDYRGHVDWGLNARVSQCSPVPSALMCL